MYGDDRVTLNVGERQLAVTRLTALGYSAALIADRLTVSPRTVVRHRTAQLRVATPPAVLA